MKAVELKAVLLGLATATEREQFGANWRENAG